MIRQLQDTVNGGMVRYMIIGPGCSSAAILIAETAPFYQLTQVRIIIIMWSGLIVEFVGKALRYL